MATFVAHVTTKNKHFGGIENFQNTFWSNSSSSDAGSRFVESE